MQKLVAIAIDDEPLALQLLTGYASQVPYLEWAGTFRNPLDALQFLQTTHVDVLFLDLNMPNIDGLSFYRSLPQKPKVIFTTAYPEFAVESYEVQATDYLLKPIEFPRFLRACNKLINGSTEINQQPSEKKDSIYIKSGSKWINLKWPDVLFLEKSENYIIFHTRDNRKVLNRQNMTEVVEIVPDYFCRIHKSYIVNLKEINTIEREEITVAGQKLPVSETFRETFIKKCDLSL